MRRELAPRLGVDGTGPVNDVCEIAGTPRPVLRLFSTRRDEIETDLERLGAAGSKATDDATLATQSPSRLSMPKTPFLARNTRPTPQGGAGRTRRAAQERSVADRSYAS